MGLFSRKKDRAKKKQKQTAPEPAKPVVVLNDPPVSFFVAPGDTLTGHLRGNANVLIRGAFEGEIEVSGLVWVAEDAELFGFVQCSDAHLAGKVGGTVRAEGVIDLNPNVECRAELEYGRIWRDGAFEKPPAPEPPAEDATAQTSGTTPEG